MSAIRPGTEHDLPALTDLYNRALLDVLATEGLHRAYAGVTLANGPSLALHRRLGFVDVGVFREVGFKLGRFWDVAFLEKAL